MRAVSAQPPCNLQFIRNPSNSLAADGALSVLPWKQLMCILLVRRETKFKVPWQRRHYSAIPVDFLLREVPCDHDL